MGLAQSLCCRGMLRAPGKCGRCGGLKAAPLPRNFPSWKQTALQFVFASTGESPVKIRGLAPISQTGLAPITLWSRSCLGNHCLTSENRTEPNSRCQVNWGTVHHRRRANARRLTLDGLLNRGALPAPASSQSSFPMAACSRSAAKTPTAHWLRWKLCVQLQNTFGPPAKWLSRSQVTRHVGGQWPLVGDKGVIVAGGPQNISGNIRRDDGIFPSSRGLIG